jgi:hypothetical protein
MRACFSGRVLGAALVLGTLLASTGCRQESALPDPISREEYIDLYVEILRVADESPDSVTASERALAILIQRGVSEEDLLVFARNHMDDPEYLVELWSEIEERLRNPEPADSTEQEEPESEKPKSEDPASETES